MKGIVLDLKDISDSREVMESKEAPGIRWFIYIVLAVFIAALGFSFFSEVDEYSRVTGEVRTASAAGSVMSASGCKLSSINVEEGQSVKEGDVLFTLDSDYADEQKSILEGKLENYESELDNTKLLKQSVEENKNLFSKSDEDSKYYYRYEQYKNGVLLSSQEIERSQLNNSLTSEEKTNTLKTTEDSIKTKKDQLAAYRDLLSAVRNDTAYTGSSSLAGADYSDYKTSYDKAAKLAEQYRTAYEAAEGKLGSQDTVTAFQLESAKSDADTAAAAVSSCRSSYLSDIRTQIILLTNQIANDANADHSALDSYNELKTAIEQGLDFSSSNQAAQSEYNSYISDITSLSADYENKMSAYEELYNTYSAQSTAVSQSDVDSARIAYESALLDADSVKNGYISKINAAIVQLEEEIKTLEANKKSLELAIKGADDLKEYEKLSGDKLKNEAIVSLNAEIDSIKENISSVEAQLTEVNETIKNSEIRASMDGTVTLLDERHTGDIVQAGETLCTLVPDTDSLKVTLYIPENEVSKIEVGQKTEYMFDSIPYTEYGKVTGEIKSVSADSISNQNTGMKYYVAQADLSAMSLENGKGEVREIKNGMLVQGKVISNSKKTIVWLLEKMNLKD